MQVWLTKYSQDQNQTLGWNHEKRWVRCVCHKLALMVNAGLQALGIQAPPPPLVKSTILGDFPISTTTLHSIPKENEAEEEEETCTDKESGLTEDVDDTDIKLSQDEDSTNWYKAQDGPHPEPDINIEDINSIAPIVTRQTQCTIWWQRSVKSPQLSFKCCLCLLAFNLLLVWLTKICLSLLAQFHRSKDWRISSYVCPVWCLISSNAQGEPPTTNPRIWNPVEHQVTMLAEAVKCTWGRLTSHFISFYFVCSMEFTIPTITWT